MKATETDIWSSRARSTLERYDEPLIRLIAARLFKPRNQWSAEDLIDRTLDTLANPPAIDRKLRELPASSRDLLGIIGRSHQSTWRIGQLLHLLAVVGHVEGFLPVQVLLETGLLYPVLQDGVTSLKQFEDWLGPDGMLTAQVWAYPLATIRGMAEPLNVPAPPAIDLPTAQVRTSDGLDWFLNTALIWQLLVASPLRLTQQQSLFKRDLTRLQGDERLNAAAHDTGIELPDVGLLAVELARAIGLVEPVEGELKASHFPASWEQGLPTALGEIAAGLGLVRDWDPLKGFQSAENESLLPSVGVAGLLSLAALPAGSFTQISDVANWLAERHPSWFATLNGSLGLAEIWLRNFFIGVALPLRLTEAVQNDGQWLVRLGSIGRHFYAGAPVPGAEPGYPQTLIVQPNGELVVYRQGLTPSILARLARCAEWKAVGPACLMALSAESVYRGLESGLNLQDITLLLRQHGGRELPATVLDSLQRWASKRERITVYPAATLLEFLTAEDLELASDRGLVALKLTDRIGISAGQEPDYKQFRLVGNRDYESRPQRCLGVGLDGVTLSVDVAQSDLLLEAELSRFTEPLLQVEGSPRRVMITPASLRSSQQLGLSLSELEQWFTDRTGNMLSPAVRMLFLGSSGMAGECRNRIVMRFPSELLTDGVLQWPPTAELIEERLGPTAVCVAEEKVGALIKQLGEIGVPIESRRCTDF